MQSPVQFNSKWILQLISGISNDLQILLKYFNGTTICVFFTRLLLLAVSAVVPTITVFYLNDLELLVVKSALLAGTSSLLNCRKLPNVSE